MCGARGIWEISVSSSQFYCELKRCDVRGRISKYAIGLLSVREVCEEDQGGGEG